MAVSDVRVRRDRYVRTVHVRDRYVMFPREVCKKRQIFEDCEHSDDCKRCL